MISLIGTLWNRAGLSSIASQEADPRFVSHISSHPGGMDVSGELADCGVAFGEVVDAGRTAPICARCAEIHADQPWIQRLK